ncbi:MAG: hypothetical protein K2Y51_13690, partial [Gammaproteobacteria bacterium]|nr:hypothetical protein [Gammaproteobacteria bacterium]
APPADVPLGPDVPPDAATAAAAAEPVGSEPYVGAEPVGPAAGLTPEVVAPAPEAMAPEAEYDIIGEEPLAPEAAPVAAPEAAAPTVTEDAAEAARAKLREKLGGPAAGLTEAPQTVTERKKAKQVKKEGRSAAERYAQDVQIKPDTDDLLAAIAKAGGISREQAEAAGIDRAEFGRKGWKIKRVFTTSGDTLEGMSEKLAQLGYPVTDENGQYGENAMLAALDRALRGEKLGTAKLAEDRMEAMAAERDADLEAEDPFGVDGLALADEEYAGLESTQGQAVFDAMERARDAGLSEDEIEVLAERAAIKELSNEEFLTEIQQAADAKRGHSGSAAQVPGEPGEGSRAEAPPALEAYSAEDLAAREQQKADAERARQEADKKAQADDQRGSFVLTGSDSAVDQAEARGQSNLFDAPPAARGLAVEPPERKPEEKPAARGLTDAIDSAAHEAATSPKNDLPEPTQAQKEAGNYRKGKIRFQGHDISIENPIGSKRQGIDDDGGRWSVTMRAHYGYIRRSEGADGEHVDVYLPNTPDENAPVFVVDQVDPRTGKFDESKVIMGVNSEDDARRIYDAHFSDGSGPRRRRAISRFGQDQFREWVYSDASKGPALEPEQSEARAVQSPAVQDVAEHEGPMRQSAQSVLSQLRGAGDQGLSGVERGPGDVSARRGREAKPEPFAGSDQQQRPLRTGERALGDEEVAGPEHEKESTSDSQREDANADRVGGRDRRGSIDIAVPPQSGRAERGRSADDAASGRANSEDSVASSEAAPADGQTPAQENAPKTNAERLKEIPPSAARRVMVTVDQLVNTDGVERVEATQMTAAEALADIRREIHAFNKLLSCVRK